MQMDEGEIIREYKQARNRMKEVGILADLNCVTKNEMAHWLRDHGQEVPKNFFIGEKKANKVPEEVVTKCEVVAVPEIGKCLLTVGEAYNIAELVDMCLLDTIRNDSEWDSMRALKNIVYAYDKLCKYSGYKGVTE